MNAVFRGFEESRVTMVTILPFSCRDVSAGRVNHRGAAL